MENKARMAVASHIAHGDKKRMRELLKLSDEELWKEFDKHSTTCLILRD